MEEKFGEELVVGEGVRGGWEEERGEEVSGEG